MLQITNQCIILHVPHASTYIPDDINKGLLLSDEELRDEILHMTDYFTDQLFSLEGATVYKSEVSRLVVDMERFRDNSDEIMSEKGMGAVYELTSNGEKLRHFYNKIREDLLITYYDPYHTGFNALADSLLEEHNQCLIIDCHSFPYRPLPYELDQNPERPDFCLGTCNYHTPESLIKFVQSRLSKDYKVFINRPFAGTFVPGKYYLNDKRVMSLMVEVNRELYMDQFSGQKNEGFDIIKNLLNKILRELALFKL